MTLPSRRLTRLLLLITGASLFAVNGFGATADISNVPLGTSSVRPKPNIMFILDDSGSMDSKYMPDEMSNSGRYGYWSSQCNGVAYNPSVTYLPPVDYQGTVYPNATFTNAWRDGYNTSGSKTNLNTSASDATYYRYTGSQTAMNWTYSTGGSVDTTTTFYSECMTWIGSGGAPFEEIRVTSSSTDAQNYANWFAYYRTRMNMMRTATGRAFAALDGNYRVGFTVISDSSVSGDHFLDIADFASGTGGQKDLFYQKLYTVFNQDYTPLRGALSKIGQYYGLTAPSQSYDPIQYSCQRNYAILSTDGYWNTDIETTTYGPYALNGSSVGQQDGDEQRPMKDSATTKVTTVTGTQRTDRRTYTGTASLTGGRLRRSVTQITTSGCSGGRKKITTSLQQASAIYQAPRVRIADVVVTTTRTVITVNGVQTSDTSSTNTSSETQISDTLGDRTLTSTGTWSTVSGSSSSTSCSTMSDPTGTTYGDPYVHTEPTSTAWAGGTPTPDVAQGTPVAYPSEPQVTTLVTGGASNALADVAEYYWKTDLRSSMTNDVAAVSGDSATYQHMNTFTVGLGVRGTLTYDSAYLTQQTGDYADLKSGAKNWPNPGAGATKIDDLWHAAVNGRGQYFSATDPTSLSNAIATTLAKIQEQTGAGAAAAASTLTPTTGDDWIFLPSYAYNPEAKTSWYGDLRAFKFIINSTTGEITVPETSDANAVWSARARLESRNLATDDRTLYFSNGTALTAFTYANLTSAGKNASFDNRCTTASPLLTQCTGMAATPKAKVTGANMVAFLRGDTSLYLNASDENNRVFRTRTYRLGDFVNASPVYVSKPPFKYADSGYAAFVSANANRTKVVYAAGNDGMLHAFKVGTGAEDNTGGTELWAFIPSAVLPELWRLADSGYDANHRYFVDATPVVGDVYDGTQWRTILVGGLGAGGRSYYALDVTNPTAPTLLWEISNANTDFAHLGLTYGNPIITKNSAGTWIVAFTTGLNNVTGSADGKGRLYIVNAVTGAKLGELNTEAGGTDTPSNLTRIEGWVQSTSNNTVLRFYGGDMLGNVWRFDHDNRYPPTGADVLLMGTAMTAASSGVAQPITSKPILTELSNGGTSVPILSFGTGRYLGSTDITDTTLQSVYALRDATLVDGKNLCGATSGACNLRSTDASLVTQSLNSSRTVASPASVNWSTQNGWVIDLNQSSGERIFLDGESLAAGVLAFASAVPNGSICAPDGVSYLYQFSLNKGTVLAASRSSTLIVGVGRVLSSNGTTSAIVTRKDQKVIKEDSGTSSLTGGNSVRRATWRELID